MKELFEKLKIKPKSQELYKSAFSHSSYSNEHKVKNNYERLEFLGDAVLDLVVADYLYNHFKDTEGEMTKIGFVEFYWEKGVIREKKKGDIIHIYG